MYRRVIRIAFLFFGIIAIGYFGTSLISSFAGEFYLNNPIFHVLFAFILILLTVLFAVFVRNLVLFFFPHFKTNLRLKIFTAFVLLILGPALFTIFLSSGVVNKGLDRLLKIQVKRIVDISRDTTDQFIQFISDDLKRKIQQLKGRKNIYPYTLKVYGIDGFLKADENGKVKKVGNISLTRDEIESLKNLENYTLLDTETAN